MKDYNEIIFNLLKSKFTSQIIKEISKDLLILDKSYILFKLKYLFELLSKEMGKLYNGINLEKDYFIKRILKMNFELDYTSNIFVIFNHDQNIKLNSNNKNLTKCINKIINFIESIPPWDNLYLDLDLSQNNLNLFVDENITSDILTYIDILENPNEYDEYQINNAIMFFELMKNNYRNNKSILYEYYEKLQEQYYQILNINYENEEEAEELIFMLE